MFTYKVLITTIGRTYGEAPCVSTTVVEFSDVFQADECVARINDPKRPHPLQNTTDVLRRSAERLN